MTKIFIDGQAGTTGLQITERLAQRQDLELLYLSDSERKDNQRRAECLDEADISILCLPDDAAREALTLAPAGARILDASTAHRNENNWVYGLPELDPNQRDRITAAQYVSNPGCYPQGFILMVRPLIDAGLISPQLALRCHAVSGYSGGGRQMIETQQAYDELQRDRLNSQVYALNLEHKHVGEMQRYSGTQRRPLFTPTVANYYKGMLVQLPLFAHEVNNASARDIHEVLQARYEGERFIRVYPPSDTSATENGYLNPTAVNDSNIMEIMQFGNEEQLLLIARYDNLGKGAAGAAVQNLNLMLGVDEALYL